MRIRLALRGVRGEIKRVSEQHLRGQPKWRRMGRGQAHPVPNKTQRGHTPNTLSSGTILDLNKLQSRQH